MQKIGNDYSVAFLANTGVLFNINPEPFVNKYFSYSDGNALYPHSASDVQKPIEVRRTAHSQSVSDPRRSISLGSHRLPIRT